MSRKINGFRFVPKGSEPASFQISGYVLNASLDTQAGQAGISIWAEHNDENPAETRIFRVFETGEFVPDRSFYVGTVMFPDGAARHVYDVSESEL